MMQVMIFRAIIHEPPSVPVPRRPDAISSARPLALDSGVPILKRSRIVHRDGPAHRGGPDSQRISRQPMT